MANISNYRYKHYQWQRVHTDVERKCLEVRKRFLAEMSNKQSIRREEIIREYISDNTLISLQCIPTEEMAALLQWFEMRNDLNDIYCSIVFDAICNLWNYLSEYDVRFYETLPIQSQLEYVARKKTEFLSWYSKKRKITVKESQTLISAIHMPTYHRVSGHGILELMVSYLLC